MLSGLVDVRRSRAFRSIRDCLDDVVFGDVSCGATGTAEISIINQGTIALPYRIALAEGSAFTVHSPNGTIAPNATAHVVVTVHSTLPGDTNEVIAVEVGGTTRLVGLSARVVGAMLVADHSFLDFGEVRFDQSAVKAFSLRNVGNSPAVVEAFESEGFNGVYDGVPESIAVEAKGVSIAPGASMPIDVALRPSPVSEAPTRAKLTIRPAAAAPHCEPPPFLDVTARRVDSLVTLSAVDFGRPPCGKFDGTTRDLVITSYAPEPFEYSVKVEDTVVGFYVQRYAGETEETTYAIPAATSSGPAVAKVVIARADGTAGLGAGSWSAEVNVNILGATAPTGGMRRSRIYLEGGGAYVSGGFPSLPRFETAGTNPIRRGVSFANSGDRPIILRYTLDEKDRSVWTLETTRQLLEGTRELGIFFHPPAGDAVGTHYSATIRVERDEASSWPACSAYGEPLLPEVRIEGDKITPKPGPEADASRD